MHSPLRSSSAFSLVELIVVITILVILGTISLLSFGGYSSSARDSARIENLSGLQKGLDVFRVKTGSYPMPESSVNITASGTTIAYQGLARDQIATIVNLPKAGVLDPLDPTLYPTYSVNTLFTKSELMGFLENPGSTTSSFPSDSPILSIQASVLSNYSKRTPLVRGDMLGIVLASSWSILNQPVQETGTGIDIVTTQTGYSVYFSSTLSISGTGSSLRKTETINLLASKNRETSIVQDILNGSLVGYWDMETLASPNKLKDLSGNGNDGAGLSGIVLWDSDWNGKGGRATGSSGMGGIIQVAAASNLDLATIMSLAVWIKDKGTSTSWSNLLSKCDFASAGYAFQRSWNNSNVYLRIDTGSTGALSNQTDGPLPSVLDGGWHLVVWTLDNGIKRWYKDGIMMADTTYFPGSGFSLPSSPLYLIAPSFKWAIDEVRLYNRILSPIEVQSLYNATR